MCTPTLWVKKSVHNVHVGISTLTQLICVFICLQFLNNRAVCSTIQQCVLFGCLLAHHYCNTTNNQLLAPDILAFPLAGNFAHPTNLSGEWQTGCANHRVKGVVMVTCPQWLRLYYAYIATRQLIKISGRQGPMPTTCSTNNIQGAKWCTNNLQGARWAARLPSCRQLPALILCKHMQFPHLVHSQSAVVRFFISQISSRRLQCTQLLTPVSQQRQQQVSKGATTLLQIGSHWLWKISPC